MIFNKTAFYPKKVLLFANVGSDIHSFYHVGDEAMFLEIYSFYQRNFPDAKLSALVSSPFRPYLNLSERLEFPWPRKTWVARLYFFKLIARQWLVKHTGISLFSGEQKDFIEFIKKHDVIHFTGGGNLNTECGFWLYYSLFITVVAQMYGRKVILSSQSIGPLSWIDRVITLRFLNSVQSIMLREATDTHEKWLRQEGLDKPQIVRSLDAAYFFPPAQIKLPKKKGVFRVGLSVHQRGNNTDKIESAVKTILSLVGAQYQTIEVLLLPHSISTAHNSDTLFLKTISSSLPPSIKIITPDYYSIGFGETEIAHVLRSYTASCDMLVSSRYHGVIFGLSADVPTLTIVDGEYQRMKNVEALRFVFGERALAFVVDLNSRRIRSDLQKGIYNVLNNLPKIATEIRERNKVLKEQYNDYLAWLKKQVLIP